MLYFPSLDKFQVDLLRKEIIGKSCNNACLGAGCKLENGVFVDCSCVREFTLKCKYAGAGVPKKYWDFTFRVLLKAFIDENAAALTVLKKYVEKIEDLTSKGVGLYIQGALGLAKSSLAFYIVKEALKKDITSYSIRMSQLTKLLIDATKDSSKQALVDWIKADVKLLYVDEIEKDFNVSDPTHFYGMHVNDFFGLAYDTKKSLILTSNLPKTGLRGIHADNIIDRFEELADVLLVGESFRRPGEALQQILGI